jgi:hypothetical protein
MKQGKKINYTKWSKKIRVEKNLIKGINFFNWRVKLNWKRAIIKGKTNQKNNGQIKKNDKKIDWMSTKMKNKTYEKLQMNRDDNLIRTWWMLTWPDSIRPEWICFFFFLTWWIMDRVLILSKPNQNLLKPNLKPTRTIYIC